MEVPHKHVQVHKGSGAQAPLPFRSNTASFHLVRGPGGQLTKEVRAAAFDSHCAEIDAPCCRPRLLIHKLKAWQLDAEKCPMLALFVEHYQAWRKCVANYMEVDFFFSRAFLRLHCGNPVEGMGEPYAEAAVGRRLQRPGWEATGQDGEFPTEQLRQVRDGFIAVDFSCKWELKQGGRVCPLGCDCEQCRPSRDPGRLCSRPEVGRHGGCPLPGEQAQEACSLVAKASAYLNADDNQAAAARTC